MQVSASGQEISDATRTLFGSADLTLTSWPIIEFFYVPVFVSEATYVWITCVHRKNTLSIRMVNCSSLNDGISGLNFGSITNPGSIEVTGHVIEGSGGPGVYVNSKAASAASLVLRDSMIRNTSHKAVGGEYVAGDYTPLWQPPVLFGCLSNASRCGGRDSGLLCALLMYLENNLSPRQARDKHNETFEEGSHLQGSASRTLQSTTWLSDMHVISSLWAGVGGGSTMRRSGLGTAGQITPQG